MSDGINDAPGRNQRGLLEGCKNKQILRTTGAHVMVFSRGMTGGVNKIPVDESIDERLERRLQYFQKWTKIYIKYLLCKV